MLKKIYIYIILCGIVSQIHAATITWTGAVDNLWSNAGNWNPAQVPAAADKAFFDNSLDCNMDDHVLVGGIELTANYTGTLTQTAGKNLYIGYDGFVMNGGVFKVGNGIGKLWGAFAILGGVYESPLDGTFNAPVSYGDFAEVVCRANNRLEGDQNLNFIREEILQIPILNETDMDELPVSQKMVRTTYYDDRGMPIQSVSKQYSFYQKDIVLQKGFDQFGRPVTDYLPYADANGCNGDYKEQPDAAANLLDFYSGTNSTIAKTTVPYGTTIFEHSPHGRVLETAAPGEVWQYNADNAQRHTNKTDISSYDGNASIPRFTYDFASSSANASVSTVVDYYAADELIVSSNTDENGLVYQSYIDKQEQLIAKIMPDGTRTYYVYDDFGNIRFMVSPEAVNALSGQNYTLSYSSAANDFADKWLYTYRYDSRQRVTERKVPGAGPVKYFYDQLNRIVLMQDANQAAKTKAGNQPDPEYTFSKYDIIGRTVMTGVVKNIIHNDGDLRSLVAESAILYESYSDAAPSGDQTKIGYTLNNAHSFLQIDYTELRTLNYYDRYQDSGLQGTAPDGATAITKGMLTAAKVKKGNSWLTTLSYFDRKGRPVEEITNNQLNNTSADVYTYVYDDFTGRLQQRTSTRTTQVISAVTVKESYTYDHVGRLTLVKHKINDNAEINLAKFAYNDLGQLVRKQVYSENSTDFLQSLDYRYNIRGWLTHINDVPENNPITPQSDKDLFAMRLVYDNSSYNQGGNVVSGSNVLTEQFNGNIAFIEWYMGKVTSQTTGLNTDDKKKAYAYYYDQAGRYTNATYSIYNNNKDRWESSTDFSETIAATANGNTGGYSDNGNIKSLFRYGSNGNTKGNLIDQLTYTYNGNKLQKITESAPSGNGLGFVTNAAAQALATQYTYDPNGNMLTDANKGISISYNSETDLPESIQLSGTLGQISYERDAAGSLTKKTDATGIETYYLGELEIRHDPNNASQPYSYIVHTAEGRVIANGTSYQYEFYYKDHLGNVRVVFTKSASSTATHLIAEATQQQDYYPFGSNMQQWNSMTDNYKNLYLYAGKELQEGIGLYDYGARMYDPNTGRWNAPDPHADSYESYSPYHYVYNNPVNFVDPDGKDIFGWFKKNWFFFIPGGPLAWTIDQLHERHTWLHNHRKEVIMGAAIVTAVALTIVTDGASLEALIAIGAAEGAFWGGLSAYADRGSFENVMTAAFEGAAIGAVGGALSGLASGAKWGAKGASAAEDVAAGGANSIAILPSSSEAAYPVTASIRLAERSAFPEGWAGDLLFAFSRPSEFDLPFFIGPIGSVSEKAAETGLKVLSNAAKIEAKLAAKGEGLIAKGLGSTGRTKAANLMEEMAMKNIVRNPRLGKPIMEGMKDVRWLNWTKMQYSIESSNGVKVTIHYVGKFENGVLKAVDDFKFK